jgi:hypothetical protein
MTCHKKCVAKCQMGTVCIPHGSQRRASALPEDMGQSRGLELLVPPTQARRASAQPEIITTAADDGDHTPQVSLWSYVVMCLSLGLVMVGSASTKLYGTDFICDIRFSISGTINSHPAQVRFLKNTALSKSLPDKPERLNGHVWMWLHNMSHSYFSM